LTGRASGSGPRARRVAAGLVVCSAVKALTDGRAAFARAPQVALPASQRVHQGARLSVVRVRDHRCVDSPCHLQYRPPKLLRCAQRTALPPAALRVCELFRARWVRLLLHPVQQRPPPRALRRPARALPARAACCPALPPAVLRVCEPPRARWARLLLRPVQQRPPPRALRRPAQALPARVRRTHCRAAPNCPPAPWALSAGRLPRHLARQGVQPAAPLEARPDIIAAFTKALYEPVKSDIPGATPLEPPRVVVTSILCVCAAGRDRLLRRPYSPWLRAHF